ncbi:uncharacterized protein F4812DRAFT_267096 [Daldinia caldariorum]|uniref:uncharacterized protein n=1 Tax=Daldinia caldariorum TaxID=326644 RepID=UPI00200840F0|nr:uncharacterized protein F4812DRAFT_267096 [Daldinia caldariorum]KAI1470454.1 hypothetical protein F4812DRAFT_267096 [Daldinia caldariorum]
MYWSKISCLAFTAGWFAASVRSQSSGWADNQWNATMCQWNLFRASTIGDTVYLDGGQIYWIRGLTDGSYSTPDIDENSLSLIYTLNFSTPFNSSSNFSEILTHNSISKGLNGGSANNLAPNYHSGALLGNDHEFFTYGGLLPLSSVDAEPDADDMVEYVASLYGAEKPQYQVGVRYSRLPEGITRYVTNGGAANAPSENKAWYFGGYRSESGGPIYENSFNDTTNPTTTSDYLITLDMDTQTQETWKNETIGNISSRADPSVVWVPVGEQGILVVLGGVTYPSYLGRNLTSANEAQSKKDSPGFMSNIDIYDVASKKWYQQPAQGTPPQSAMGCAVVAPAQDYSSFNIYYYGGYDGLHDTTDFNNDVWILSLPSFMWMKVHSGKSSHGRAGHHCVMPYPDQMIVIGGRQANKGTSVPCLDGDPPGILQVYNLTDNSWMEAYDPTSWNYYGVPQMIYAMIGGDSSGGATKTTPDPSGWATPDLGKVFATAYPTSKLISHYPYSSVGPGNDTRGIYGGDGGGGGTPSWVAPVLGVVLGLIFVTAVVVGFILYRRRKLWKKNSGSEPSTDENGNRILSWMHGQSDGKAPTVTTDDTRTQCDELESRGVTPARFTGQPEMEVVPEMPDTHLVELWDTSPAVELGDTHAAMGVTPTSNTNKQSPFASNPQTHQTSHAISTPTSQTALGSSHEHPSSISSQPPSYTAQRPDSPSLGNNEARFDSIANAITTDVPTNATANPGTPATRKAVVSGVSGISDREIAHLRQISDTSTASQVTALGTPPPPPQASSHHIIESPLETSLPLLPVSPPSVTGVDGSHEASDYVSVPQNPGATLGTGGNTGGSTSQPRRSVFRENEDGLEEGGQR